MIVSSPFTPPLYSAGNVSFEIEVQTNYTSSSLYAYASTDFSDFQPLDIFNVVIPSNAGWTAVQTSKFYLEKGSNKLFIVQRESGAQFKNVRISPYPESKVAAAFYQTPTSLSEFNADNWVYIEKDENN
eukprot:Awhi_evm1s7283